MWVEGNSLQQVRLQVVLDGIWYKSRDWQGERVKKPLRRPTVERNPPNLCKKHSRVNSCCAETSLHTGHCSEAR